MISESVAAASGDAHLIARFAGVLDDLIVAYGQVGDALKVSELTVQVEQARASLQELAPGDRRANNDTEFV